MSDHLLFDGRTLHWKSQLHDGRYADRYVWENAVSGLGASNPPFRDPTRNGRTDIRRTADRADPGFRRIADAGAIPPGRYYIVLEPGMPFVRWKGHWGVGAWSIYPSCNWRRRWAFAKDLSGVDLPPERGGFFLHHDVDGDGTACGIGLSARGIGSLRDHLSAHHANEGRRTMIVEVDYRTR